jgi:heme-degrading monooxygenase HmoA
MFTRVVEVTTKNGKARELCSTIREKVLPILQSQNGFVDEITLVSTNNPNRVVALSIWKSKEDAERYHNQQFQSITNLLRNHLEHDPKVETFDLEGSTVHKIAAGKAA